MALALTGKGPKTSGNERQITRSLKRKRVGADVERLQKTVQELDTRNATFSSFADIPLSAITARGLEASHYKSLTDIQSKAIPLGIKGNDVLGAAKTGSGKTLAFLVPVLENLYRQRWTELDGLGALIVSPTRELAIQIFEVLRKIGRYHSFSAGLVIGGRSLQEERERLGRMNILVCTPGRMLQHMDQTATFQVDNLQILVLDEADRIMDMGFQSSVDAILDHLPKTRQTMLFSATQTKKVSDLARLRLKDPEYVAVHETASSATPSTLKQHYIITPLPEKLNTLFSFIRANLKAKILVFLSSGKQVRFAYESFRHLQPGIPLLHLHGRQKQTARLNITTKFSTSKNSCLFATDVVARGLDFPAVDWVVQLDCPEDADTYIHRVGRTARYEKDGRAILFLDPSEEGGMLNKLQHKKVPIEKLNVRQKKQQSIQNQLQNMCFQDPELKYLGQKAFVSYTKSIFVQKDKEIFDITKIDLEGFAASMGLPGTPKIKFRKGDDAKKLKNAQRVTLVLSDDETDAETNGEKRRKKEVVRTKYDRMFERRNQDVFSGHYSGLVAENDAANDQNAETGPEEDNGFLSVKRILSTGNEDVDGQEIQGNIGPNVKIIPHLGEELVIVDSNRREKLLKSKKKLLKLKGKGTKHLFDEKDEAHEMYEFKGEADFHQQGPAESQRAKFLMEEVPRVQRADVDDKQLVKEKRREKKEKHKAREQKEDSGNYAQSLMNGGNTEDPLTLLASLPMREEDMDRPKKRPKKWFEDDSDIGLGGARQNRPTIQAAEEPETLEGLEALAVGLLE